VQVNAANTHRTMNSFRS